MAPPNQKEVNARILTMFQELLSIVTGQGYVYDPSLDTSKNDSAKICKKLNVLKGDVETLKDQLK